MVDKSEINLNFVPESGKTFTFSDSDLLEISEITSVSKPSKNNQIEIKVTPIGETHFEVKAQIKLKRISTCSRCGAEFEDFFDQEATEYLSLEKEAEGEDQGFLLLDSPKWAWPSFISESVELESPYINFDKCPTKCAQYDEAVKKGLIITESTKANPFQALEKLKNKLN